MVYPGGDFQESWEFGKFGPRIAPFSTWILGRGVQWGRHKVLGPKSTISVTDLRRRCTAVKLPISRWRDAPIQADIPLGANLSANKGAIRADTS